MREDKKQWPVRLFVILFSVSVSLAVLPCGIINVYGLFGEQISSLITDDGNKVSYPQRQVFENRKQIKGINIYNRWFATWIGVLCTAFIQYMVRLPRGDTIITRKVRMDN